MTLNNTNTAAAQDALEGLLSITATRITLREPAPSSGRSLIATVECSSEKDAYQAATDLADHLDDVVARELPGGRGWSVRGYR